MSIRTITAPGVEIKETDRSGYSPSMTGTACYIPGFTNKGEAYKPMRFTSRSAWVNYYGEPETEAEKYFYAAACETLNQNGNLYCTRLPYDNTSFERMTAFKYTLSKAESPKELSSSASAGYAYPEITNEDASIEKFFVINAQKNPLMIDLAKVDEYRTNEDTVASDSFMIVDRTCAGYKKIMEDTRKGEKRELLGIVPVITTAANALYAQNLISVENQNAKYYESLGPVFTLDANNCISAGQVGDSAESLANNAKYNTDLVRQLNSVYKNYHIVNKEATLCCQIIRDMYDGLRGILDNLGDEERAAELKKAIGDSTHATDMEKWKTPINELAEIAGKDPYTLEIVNDLDDSISELYNYYLSESGIHADDGDDTLPNTVSFEANTFFQQIIYDADLSAFQRENLKKIGVIVYKTYIDPGEGNKIQFEPVESFCGSLCKDDKDPDTKMTTFLDTIINAQSNYIYFFSNCFRNKAKKKWYDEDCDMLIMTPTDTAGSLGFYERQMLKTISVDKSIYDGLNKSFDKAKNLNDFNIDIVCDAGIANIASFIKATQNGSGYYDLEMVDADDKPLIAYWDCKSNNLGVKTWKAVEQKLDNFCKNIRKDCMFIADGPRPLVLQGNKKIIRESKPTNSLDVNVIPYLKYVSGINTSYGAGYADWFEQADDFSGDFFWCPPSIKAMGVYINTDVNYNYWDAPAGFTRGVIAATDVAFSPTPKEAGCFYEKQWNYAIDYPNDGIILEGQKTFQVRPTALDRVNVRRLMLRLERATAQVVKYFLYEGNTAYTRQRVIDAIEPYFRAAKAGGGLYDYKLICDESNNTAQTIDNNELHISIGIKPVKTIEFIIANFIIGSTGASWEEIM